jgi:hypothetical protein
VALSADGNTALVGGFYRGGVLAAAWVFTRSGTTWTQQDQEPLPLFSLGTVDRVALSADGNVALVGADESVSVFTRSGSEWTPRGEPLTASGGIGEGGFGASVALSGDGGTAMIGAPDDNGVGAAWVFTDSGSGWTQDGEKITVGGSGGSFGKSVALSFDGNTALIGAGTGSSGTAWLFRRTGPAWTPQGAGLSAGDQPGDGNFGSSVALSSDASTALVGADGAHPEVSTETAVGATYPFEFAPESPAPPTATTGMASSITPTSAMLAATVNPNGGRVTRCRFEYGPTKRYGASAPCGPSPGLGEGPVSVLAPVAGLHPATAYHFRILARNEVGRAMGIDQTFTTEPRQVPTALTAAASSITSLSATLRGTVDPNGGRVRSCRFEYGTSASYGSTVPCPFAARAGESAVAESLDVTGLSEYTEYHFRIVARNATGSSYGADLTFTTASRGSLVQLGPGTAIPGKRVALSADGDTLLVGSPRDDWGGSALVYVRSGPGWRLQARLMGGELDPGGPGGFTPDFGTSVALSGDGNTAIVGDPGAHAINEGDASLFARSGESWTRVGEVRGHCKHVYEYDCGPLYEWGRFVALSSDGNTALLGAAADFPSTWLALFSRSGSTWTSAAVPIPGVDQSGFTLRGRGALSGDGRTVLFGGRTRSTTGLGETPVLRALTLSGSSWQEQTLTLTGAIGEPEFDSGIALSANGETALVGEPGDNGGVGAAWVFTRSGSTWTQQGEKLTANNEIGAGGFGSSVALSADGDKGLIGGPGDDAGAGAAWTFTRSGEAWTQQPSKLTPSDGGSGFGGGVSLSGEGNQAVIGGTEGFWSFGQEPEAQPRRHHR